MASTAKLRQVISVALAAITLVFLLGLLVLTVFSQLFPPVFIGNRWGTVQDNALRVVESKYGVGAIQLVILDDGQEGSYRLSRRMVVPIAGERICVSAQKRRFQALLQLDRLDDQRCGDDPRQ
jgi:hypothetical protein